MASMYEPLWTKLKKNKKIKVKVPKDLLESEVTTRKKFKFLRKAISQRKHYDNHFFKDHPNARIEIISSDVKQGIIIVELIHESPSFSLMDLE